MTVDGGRNLVLRGAVIALAVVLGVVAWLATKDDGSGASASGGTERVLSAGELSRFAEGLEYPVYWAGPVAGAELQLVEVDEGVQVRYAEPGRKPAEELTIGSYPVANPRRAVAAVAAEAGAEVRSGAGGRVVTNSGSPTSVYFASPDNAVEVEVYDPRPARAMSLARSGRVQPVP